MLKLTVQNLKHFESLGAYAVQLDLLLMGRSLVSSFYISTFLYTYRGTARALITWTEALWEMFRKKRNVYLSCYWLFMKNY